MGKKRDSFLIQVSLTPAERQRMDMVKTIISLSNPNLGIVTWQHCMEWLLSTVPIPELLSQVLNGTAKPISGEPKYDERTAGALGREVHGALAGPQGE